MGAHRGKIFGVKQNVSPAVWRPRRDLLEGGLGIRSLVLFNPGVTFYATWWETQVFPASEGRRNEPSKTRRMQ